MKVYTIPVLNDNYAYVVEYADACTLAVDPSDSRPILRLLKDAGLGLTHILVTHGHGDHTAGIGDLKSKTGCLVLGPDARIPHLDRPVADNDEIALPPLRLRALSTPGHTDAAISWLVSAPGHPDAVFTGDTLFVSGCGRIMGNEPQTMYTSLQRLAALPVDTRVYVGHEYTEENCRFALSIAPDYPPFQARLSEVEALLDADRPTVPSTIETEKQANPFLLADTPVIRSALRMPDAPAWQVFAELRRRKDRF